MSSRSRLGAGSGVEKLDILLLPDDADGLPLATTELRVLVTRDLREHPLTACSEVNLDEIAEELDEHDLAVGRVHRLLACALGELDRGRPHRDERLVSHRRARSVRDGDTRPHV